MISLTKREQWLAAVLALSLGAAALYTTAVKPASHRIRTLERMIPAKQSELHALEAESAEYLALCKEYEDFHSRAASQDPDFQVLPYLESLIERHGLAGHVVTMAPDAIQLRSDCSETIVKIELDGLSLAQLVRLIREIEASEACTQIASLHIRRSPADEALLDSTIEIHSPQPLQVLTNPAPVDAPARPLTRTRGV